MNQPEPSNQAKQDEVAVNVSGTRTCPSCGLEWDRSVATCPQDGTILVSPIETDPAFSKYEFIEVCGVGGMGVVYKARQTALDKVVAIKMLHSSLLSPEAIRRFQIEGKSASMLEHPYIIKVYDLGLCASGPYMILEYLKGRTVAQVLQTEGPLSVERFLRVFIQVCGALEHAHNRGVFHRDLKPSNIMLTRSFSNEEEIRIMDFGIAKLIDETAQQGFVDKLTRTGEAIGSPAYMSPEQAQGGKIDARSDLYSLGCVMYEALTGGPPFAKTTSLETIMAHISEQPITMSQAVLGTTKFDPDLETIVARLLQKDPDRRYQSMRELQEQLISVRDGRGLGQFVYAQQTTPQKRQVLLVCFVALILVAASTVIYLISGPMGMHGTNHQNVKSLPEENKVIGLPDPISEAVANNNTVIKGIEGYTVDDDLEPLQRSTAVKELSLRKSLVSGTGLRYLAKLPTLKTLSLTKSKVYNLEYLSNAQSLEHLNIDGTGIGDVQLDQIRDLHLKSIDLSGTIVSTLHGLKDMKSLTFVSLVQTPHLGSQGMQVLGQLKNLTRLDLNFTPITDADLKYIAHLPKLQDLRIYVLAGRY